MRYSPAILACLGRIKLLVLACLLCPLAAQANNSDIYPAQPAAQSAVNWKEGYFYINGKATFLTSGEMHYARIPRELWRDRIWRAKQMGFNCLQTYVFWNVTEGKEGQWDFTDNLDLDAWLTLVHEMGLYAIVRVGPYSCGEWEHGGFPAWLTSKPGMTVRDSGPAFLRLADRHLAQVEKIVAKHQIHRGGGVILVQLENEHDNGTGTDDKDPYLKHLVEQARANGLEGPLFLSGLHHGKDPSGEKPYPVGSSPWYTTELWAGWIGRYGDMDAGMLNEKVRGTWKIIAFGGAGYNYYMIHGASNFGYSGDSAGASYDYSAAIGETGRFNNFYFPARRAAYFAQSFSSLLTRSHNDPTFAKCDLPELRVTTRTSPDNGSIVFVDHFKNTGDPDTAPALLPDASAYQSPAADKNGVYPTHLTLGRMTLPHQGSLNVVASEPRTVLVNLPWTRNASFESVCTDVMLRQTLGDTDYWICYGAPGDTGEVTLKRNDNGTPPAQFNFSYPSGDSIREIDLDSGDGHKAKLLVMNTKMTEKTWLAHDNLYIGPSFVSAEGHLEFPMEGGKATIYSAKGKTEYTQAIGSSVDLPVLSGWTWRDAATEREPDFNTKGWAQSKGPEAMANYDSFQNRYGWYRTVLHRDAAGPVALHFTGQSGEFVAFLNGKPAKLDHLNATAGDNTLAILVRANARRTYFGWTGTFGGVINRGLWGGVSTEPLLRKVDLTWKYATDKVTPGTFDHLEQMTSDDPNWQPLDFATAPESINHKFGKAIWIRGSGTFDLTADQLDSTLQGPSFGGTFSSLILNGQALDSLSQGAKLQPGKNTILCQFSQKRTDTKIDAPSLALYLWKKSPLSNATWEFRGGLTGLQETAIIGKVTNWNEFMTSQPWQTGIPATTGLPTFWKTAFTYHHPVDTRETIGLLTSKIMRRGQVWLNGHNLGEGPQKVPLYLPECWLKEGENDLVVFDFYGQNPDGLKLTRNEAFSVAPSARR